MKHGQFEVFVGIGMALLLLLGAASVLFERDLYRHELEMQTMLDMLARQQQLLMTFQGNDNPPPVFEWHHEQLKISETGKK